MGFGHRVYKNFDPRATVMKQSADEVLELLGVENNPILATAKALEEAALADPYFSEKKLFPNRRFLFGHHPRSDGFPNLDVYPDLRALAHGRLDFAMEGTILGPGPQDRPPRVSSTLRTNATILISRR